MKVNIQAENKARQRKQTGRIVPILFLAALLLVCAVFFKYAEEIAA